MASTSQHNEGITAPRRGSILFNSDEKRKQSVANLTSNTSGEIRNPLVGVPREELMQDVEEFAATNGLQDILPLLRKGALAAQSPHLIESIPELDGAERETFRREITHRWHQPKILYFTIILNSIAAAIQGWDQTGSNGANLSFPDAFVIDEGPDGPCAETGTCEKNQWLVGFINSCPYFAIFLLYVEMLEKQQTQLIRGLQELYRQVKKTSSWSGPPLREPTSGNPLTHYLLRRLGVLTQAERGSGVVFEEEPSLMQQQFLAGQRGSTRRPDSLDCSSDSGHYPTLEGSKSPIMGDEIAVDQPLSSPFSQNLHSRSPTKFQPEIPAYIQHAPMQLDRTWTEAELDSGGDTGCIEMASQLEEQKILMIETNPFLATAAWLRGSGFQQLLDSRHYDLR